VPFNENKIEKGERLSFLNEYDLNKEKIDI
jgi:hypothetical protein